MLDLYRVEDGATHTVIANSETQAIALYIEHSGVEEWPTERPEVAKMLRQTEYVLDIGGGKKIALTGFAWCDLIGRPHYLGSSEY